MKRTTASGLSEWGEFPGKEQQDLTDLRKTPQQLGGELTGVE